MLMPWMITICTQAMMENVLLHGDEAAGNFNTKSIYFKYSIYSLFCSKHTLNIFKAISEALSPHLAGALGGVVHQLPLGAVAGSVPAVRHLQDPMPI